MSAEEEKCLLVEIQSLENAYITAKAMCKSYQALARKLNTRVLRLRKARSQKEPLNDIDTFMLFIINNGFDKRWQIDDIFRAVYRRMCDIGFTKWNRRLRNICITTAGKKKLKEELKKRNINA